jgi:hypothetical protein
MAVGICTAVYPCDQTGTVASPPISPTDPNAQSIYFEVNTALAVLPQDQLDLKRDVERMLHALSRLFLPDAAPRESEFRPYYVQLLRLAQLGLAGPTATPDIAKRALEGMTADLIDNEGGNIKNAHMHRLAKWALGLSIPCLLLYAILCFLDPTDKLYRWLTTLSVTPITLSCFMLLWVGCFAGVVLSYGARTTTMTLNDLTNTDADRWLPQVRLLFAGSITMVFGIFLLLGIVEFKLGSTISTAEIATSRVVSFLLGVICGLSELTLPGTVAKKAAGLLDTK